MAQERPLSPHIQVYRPQMTSVLSILHRVTGVWLSIGAVFLVWWLVALSAGPDAFGAAQGFFGSWLGRVFLLGWSFSAFYHLANGLRHLAWDAGFGFGLDRTYALGWLVVGATALLTAVSWVAAAMVGS